MFLRVKFFDYCSKEDRKGKIYNAGEVEPCAQNIYVSGRKYFECNMSHFPSNAIKWKLILKSCRKQNQRQRSSVQKEWNNKGKVAAYAEDFSLV